MNKILQTAAVAAISIAGSSYAAAQNAEGYADVGVNVIQFDGAAVLNPDETYDVTTIQGRVGYQMNKFFSLELDLSVGVGEAEVEDQNFGTLDTIKAGTFAGIYARGGFNPVEKLHVFGKVGAVGGDLEITVQSLSNSSIRSESEGNVNGIGYGLGFQLDFTDKLFVRGDYTRYDMESEGGFEIEADTFGIAVGTRF